MRMTRTGRTAAALLVAAAAVVALTTSSCSSPSPAQQNAAQSEINTGQLQANQPVAQPKFSPTLEAVNQWIGTWESAPGKLAYVYVFMGGQPVGYYVIKGPPVSYAQGATQPYRKDCDSAGCMQFPNPGQDGAYANQGTGQFQWYGINAQDGSMVEWGGGNSSYLLSSVPLAIRVPPLSSAVIGQVKGR